MKTIIKSSAFLLILTAAVASVSAAPTPTPTPTPSPTPKTRTIYNKVNPPEPTPRGSSDRRLKRNIKPMSNGLSLVMELNPVTYDKKNNLSDTDYPIKESGFIAQELRKVLPELVIEGTDKDHLLTVNYAKLTPILTKAIQQQQKEIIQLQEMVKKLSKEKK
jgi:hypothetical protein